MAARKMTEEEKILWDRLYCFVKSEVMGYDSNQSLPKQFILRLKGLTQGKFMANNKIETMANYSFEVVLNAFHICMPKITYAIKTKQFKNERNKFNYICAIVENNLNDVYLDMKKQEKRKIKIKDLVVDSLSQQKADYQTKNYKSINGVEELW